MHTWIDQCAYSKLVTDTGIHVTPRIHLHVYAYVRYYYTLLVLYNGHAIQRELMNITNKLVYMCYDNYYCGQKGSC